MNLIAPHIEAFLREHLGHHRGASPHTCDSYAYSFQLLFEFAAKRLKLAPSALMLERLDAELVGIESARASCRCRVTVLALSVARRVHNSTMAAFRGAPR